MFQADDRAVAVLTGSPEPLSLFVLSHYPAQNRFSFFAGNVLGDDDDTGQSPEKPHRNRPHRSGAGSA
ncbi:hypothetical protein F9K88_17820 [Brucella intermedia]|nr:hypothetical protein F9K72_10190 [Brucella intermedia]KAB2708675.1 hypothetical protein F9K88_17820 [Brucella intermedia]KAB2711220.1 hypothetical protein F9K80_09375 [Brucella intermedia]MPR61644.1 hypothetical protein [Brucella intermedia]